MKKTHFAFKQLVPRSLLLDVRSQFITLTTNCIQKVSKCFLGQLYEKKSTAIDHIYSKPVRSISSYIISASLNISGIDFTDISL